MFWWISFTVFILVLAIFRSLRTFPANAKGRFRMDFLYQLLIYLFEIWLFFSLFQWILFSHAETLGYSEEGTLKRFIDFFTVYQIFIFVVIKLYDSLKIDAYTSVIYLINMALPHVENEEVFPRGFLDDNTFEELQKLIIPHEAENIRSHIFELLREYQELLEDEEHPDQYIESRIYSIKHQLYRERETLELSIEERNFHWNVSLFQRIGKW
ncbi:hypothetical protein [Exiguobacterium sp. s22]|uniref:hypothetical protein n=1 Tax=Exiguobacterium sp. s22 TaxID=2751272 RepID=UPI001BE6F64B|nr:hypothetical protein [Exiguobacterium sp. s22]